MNDNFDYAQPAELYPGSATFRFNKVARYMRFPSAAEAIQFAVEEMPRDLLRNAVLEVDSGRFVGQSIFDLYMAGMYPLARGRQ